MRGVLVVALIVAAAAPAVADTKPWETGVAPADQQRANELFAEANRLYAQQEYPPAIEKYRAALAIWDHPVIRFNLGVTLFRNDRFVEAGDALDAALKFGNVPFTPEQLAQIAEYQTKLRDHIGEVSASCTSPNTKVSLDGKDWFSCPGMHTTRVLAGEHAIVAETAAQHVSIAAGTKVSMRVQAGSLERAERRWPRWVPLTIGLSGTAVAVGAGVVSYWAKIKYEQYAKDGMVIYDPSRSLQESTDRANHYQRIARYSTIPAVIGIAAGVTGLIMLLVNRKVTRVPVVEVVPGGASASASWQF